MWHISLFEAARSTYPSFATNTGNTVLVACLVKLKGLKTSARLHRWAGIIPTGVRIIKLIVLGYFQPRHPWTQLQHIESSDITYLPRSRL